MQENAIQTGRIKVKNRKNKLSVLTGAMLAVLILYSLFLLSMLFWSLFTALKEPYSFDYNRAGLPDPWYFKNFRYVLENATITKDSGDVAFGEIVWNSIVYAVGCAIVNTLVMCVVAYLCARYACRFSKLVYSIVLIVMVVPIVGNQVSELQMSIWLGLYDHMYGMIVMRANFLGIYFLVFYDIFKSQPKEYSEAAEIDGASDMQIMLKVYFPLAANTFFTILLINFITYWNNYQTPMVFVPNHPTLAEYVFQIRSDSSGDFSTAPVQMAASLMVLLPVVILFVAFNKRLLGNLAIGGIKG